MKKALLIIAFASIYSFVIAQITAPDVRPEFEKPQREKSESGFAKGFDKTRLFTGGGFGLQLGRSTYLECSPTLGYKVTERLWPGLGFNYQYWRQTDQFGQRYSQNILGWRAFASYQVFESIIGYGEYESLQLNFQGTELFMNNAWLGVGFRQWIGTGSAIDALLLRNMNYAPGNIQAAFYGSPWNIKMSLIIGFN